MTAPPEGAFAYVTLVTNDEFVTGARALARSIQACGAHYPLLVMTTFMSRELEGLADLGAQLVEVQPPEVSPEFKARHAREEIHGRTPFTKGNKPAFHAPLDNFCKLRLWEFTDHDRLVFLDADTLMVRSCDKLFGYPEFSAAPNLYESLADMHRLNSGVFVAKPSEQTYAAMIESLDAPGALWRRTDQTFLQAFFPDWHGLPYTFNCLQYVYLNLPELWCWQNLHVIHYQYEKPWQNDHPKGEYLKPVIQLWQEVNKTGQLPDQGPEPALCAK